ncbi:MAG TPA: glycoside hydrolase family 2 TIM barrel-domain containing protein [Anaerohalosphaeraceae bacterium]|nr:glycoside hydrolase family 2 TIM barrel-domain containing protein [Anaerohalosphaeraceae bacterium]HPP56444.1 glycoside hydrolase family 2 TIM barrel-domain containing protein [Anaerohalosphaeraceae bacterium]
MKRFRNAWMTVILLTALLGTTGYGWTLKQAPLMTPWAQQVNPAAVLPEYPRPQMIRSEWMNLNGLWQYQPGNAGDPVPTGQTLSGEILVPFPVESAISGVMEHHERLWYRRTFTVPTDWQGRRILLHFDAVDWEAEVYVNGTSVGVHKGGYDPFTFDITPHLTGSGPQEVIVRVYDPTNSQAIACGKQDLNPSGIWYTAVTGIWQTVWLEPVPEVSIERLKIVPDVDNQLVRVKAIVNGSVQGLTVEAVAFQGTEKAGQVSGAAGEDLKLRLRNVRLWSPDDPYLYDLKVRIKQGTTVLDEVQSYFGMRKIGIGMVNGVQRLLLNGKFVFQIGPLDQGWWPDGLYRAPTDEALKWDLDMIKAFGFNMVRKHVKIEPARWYYWADKLGLLVWQDMPSMRSDSSAAQRIQFEWELEQMVEELGNHPSIIMWIVFNEGWGQYDTVRLTQKVMEQDPSRLVSCASGWTDYPVGHLIDKHSYPAPGGVAPTETRASVCGEFGGIGMRVEGHMWNPNSWGYTMVNTGQELAALYDAYIQQLAGLRDELGLSAGVYTQITDVEVEINGLITYDRKVIKADVSAIRQSNAMNRSFEGVVPTSEKTAQTWRYTTSQPNTGWMNEGFNDSGWPEGPGGFGTTGTPGAVVGTVWNTSDIWIRRTFTLPSLTPEQMNRLVLRIHHDEDAEVYLNGVLAATVTNYTTSYVYLPINAAARAALRAGQSNLIAVHCHQTAGGQFIDVGLALETVQTTDACGQWGYPYADLNQDCRVDFGDLAMLASEWSGML